jgi:hypothetical protein
VIPQIEYNLEGLRAACVEYGKYSQKSEAEVVAKQSGKLAWNIYRGLKALAPERGAVRAERLAALAAGEGIKIRKSVLDSIEQKYGDKGARGLSTHALAVKKELGLRESGRGFLAFSTPRPARSAPEIESSVRSIMSRYGFELSDFVLNVSESAEKKVANLHWNGSKGDYTAAVEGLLNPKQQAVIAQAVSDTTKDTVEYILRKIREDKSKARLQ